MGASSGSKATPEAPTGLRPSGYDPEREARYLAPNERRYVVNTPLQEPSDAGVIAWRCGERDGARFAGFARRQAWLFQRIANCYGSAFQYRLSADGRFVREAAIAIETQSATTAGRGPKDESAG